MDKKKVIVVGGPTATGKTQTAFEIARSIGGEIISADSRQIYKYLDIGTNKEIPIDIPIHLINLINPDERFNVYEFQTMALKKIDEIISRGKVPIIVGGTGLYIDSLIRSYELRTKDENYSGRSQFETLSVAELQQLINSYDSSILSQLNNSDKNNPRRLIRLLEKTNETVANNRYNNLDFLFLYPEYDWEKLKEKINSRVEKMFESGLIEETRRVIQLGYSKNCDGLNIMGYKQIVEFLDSKINLTECIEQVKIAHKQYAKRQRTWFEGKGRGYKLTKYNNTNEALDASIKFLK
ncbi:MAG: tRNA (adenosine(37)-N6)-dimethylallyltransferase MiaA [Candidatus Dojkabacteria bacterium]